MAEYSISQIGTYETCARQYKFIYKDRIKRYEEGVEAFLGQRFHETMEYLYKERAFRIIPLEELLEYYEKSWAGKWRDDVKIVREVRQADDYRRQGRRFIEDYYKRHHPFDDGRVLKLEAYIKFPLDKEGKYRFRGIIDRLMLAPDGTYEIHDYKTSSSLPEQAEVDKDRQLALYQIGVQTLWPDAKEVRLIWHYVAFDMAMKSQRNTGELQELKEEIAGLIDKIEAEREFTPNESKLCDWCAYWDLCPVKKHLVKINALPRDKWKDEPGVVIADAFAERWRMKRDLEAQTRAVDEELEKIRQAAIFFAEKEGVQVIAGTEARLRVTGKDRIISPAKGSQEREELEAELKRLGVWDEVAMLDPYALEKAVAEEKGKWTGEVLERVKAYVRSEKRYVVTLKE
ncbi:MAG: PD-(D/E)XK nuclease family protein [Acidobacteriota bacterium]|nr:PD-(D/E)XK nuclease family protein [Acidobacteriota bacterium]